ncbi:alpha/beta fold hydrolase [Agilicoccus flavus]|uniref:alpha/beta fold hydrolase n=1 Tax=Agilicoccus flavus TaxID=2775968 RepID=UPI001CF6AD04|nr:alpha/beta hydrolase [Agilicoccus flavus]
MAGESRPRRRGVPSLPSLASGAGRRGLPVVGVGLGLAAASLTAVAGLAADRLSRDRRLSVALDDDLGPDALVAVPDREVVVTTSDGIELHVEVDEPAGADPAAPTIVLSHGYCLSSRSWVFQRRAFADAGYRVVAWDQRGHGASGTGPADAYDLDRLGDDLALVIETVAPRGDLVLVGHSMGGMTMMSLALEHPDVLERVVGAAFVSTSPGGLAEVTYGLGASLGGLVHRLGPGATGLLAPRQRAVDATVRLARDVVDYLVDWGSFASPVPLSVAHLTAEMIFGTRMEVISAFFGRFDAHDKREALEAFDGIETLVLSGVQDRLTPPSHSEEIVRLVPGAEQVLVSDAGHVIMLEHPAVVSEHLLDLVARARRARDDDGAGRREHSDDSDGDDSGHESRRGGASGRDPAGERRSAGRRVPRTVTDVAARTRAARARRSSRPVIRPVVRPRRRSS